VQAVLLPHTHTIYVTFWIRQSCFALTDVMPVSSRARPTVLLLQPYSRLSGYSRKCARLEISKKHVTPFLGILSRPKPKCRYKYNHRQVQHFLEPRRARQEMWTMAPLHLCITDSSPMVIPYTFLWSHILLLTTDHNINYHYCLYLLLKLFKDSVRTAQ
jgi:hypothetical protein